MVGRPGKIMLDAARGKQQRQANLEPTEHHRGWPFCKYLLRGWNIGHDVVLWLSRRKMSRHRHQQPHFLRYQLRTTQRTALIRAGIQQPRQVDRKSVV